MALISALSNSVGRISVSRGVMPTSSLAGAATLRAMRRNRPPPSSLSDIRGRVQAGEGNDDMVQGGSVPEHLLLHLAALLRLERQRGGGAGQQSAEADRFARLVAIAVVARIDAADRLR